MPTSSRCGNVESGYFSLVVIKRGFPANIFYIMGASGAGKDSLINQCRVLELTELHCIVAHRYITRPANAGGENHIELNCSEFQQRVSTGSFAMHWEANGHLYGIGCELHQWLKAGSHVVVNGSRAYLPQAIERFGATLLPIQIQVSPAILKQRLLARGRESAEAIEQRVRRAVELADVARDNCLIINNDGPLEDTAAVLMNLIRCQAK